MNFNKQFKFTYLFMAFFLIFSSCEMSKLDKNAVIENIKDLTQSTDDASSQALKAEKHFYHAWLADCINDISKFDIYESWAVQYLTNLATKRISSATTNQYIRPVIGNEQLVWGPVLVVHDQGDNFFASKNLMYCVKSTQSGKTEYNIGIAGTNEISEFDWLMEDFDVKNQVSGPLGGKIAAGTAVGISNLQRMTSNGESLISFLNKELAKGAAEINVCGHSLGGALTQVYSALLKSQLSANAKINAWVYAGPTAGDLQFANTMDQLQSYQAYNNTLDVVPHAWQKDRLNKCCDIYSLIRTCDSKIGKVSTIDGFITYLLAQSANLGYTMPKNEFSFTGDVSNMSKGACDTLQDIVDVFWYGGSTNDLYGYLYDINSTCSAGSTLTQDEFYRFFYYMAQMADQHTTAYFKNFFGHETSDFQNAIKTLVPGETSDIGQFINGDEGLKIMEAMLDQVKTYLKQNSISNCNCN